MMAFFSTINLLIAAWALRLTWRGIAAVLGRLGPLQWPVAVSVVVYIVASFYVYSQHENMLLVHQKMLRERLQAQPIVTAAAAETATVHSIVFAWRAAVISEDALARAAWSIAEIPLYIDSSTSCEGSRCGSLIPQSREKAASEFQ